jgi:hypothetical protein
MPFPLCLSPFIYQPKVAPNGAFVITALMDSIFHVIFSPNQGCNKSRVYSQFVSRKINRYGIGCLNEIIVEGVPAHFYINPVFRQ